MVLCVIIIFIRMSVLCSTKINIFRTGCLAKQAYSSFRTHSNKKLQAKTGCSCKQGSIIGYNHNSKCLSSNSKQSSIKSISAACLRLFCSQSGPPSNKLPPLMEFPQVVWPSIIKSIRNVILTTFIIKPYLDREFNVPDFVKGSKKAVEVVSCKVAEGDTKSLEGLVTNEVIENVQKAVSLMSLSQREQLCINSEDIYFSFPYQVGIIFNDEKDQKRFVEVTMVYHALRGLAQMRSRGEEPPINMGVMPEYRNRIFICNYRFIREFTKGVESDWTINLLNHFKPSDEIEED